MKLLISILILMLCYTNAVVSYDDSVNYISNPDFSQPEVVTGDFIIGQSAGAWSEVNKLIEVGRGTFYNSRFTSGQVCELAAHYNSNIYQTINLNEGYYQLSITWAAKQNVNLLSSQFSVYLNDVLVKKFTPIDYNIHKQTLIVKANQGANKLSLRGEGINDYMGAAIKLVELFGQAKPILQYDTSVNYISNPDFSQPKVVTGDFIIGQSAGAWSEVNKLIEVGRGTFYNSRFTSGQVCELAAHYNSNIYQTINLNEGYYQLSITWAAKQNVNLLSSQFSVYWNDVLVKKFTPIDYNIHKQTLIVKANQGANKLSLRGEGINDYMGAAIKLVELFGQAKPILQYDTSVNYISNPDFSQPKVVTGDFIIGQSAGAWSEVNKLIEVGRGTFYNSRFTSGQVCELAAHYNSNIYQTINLNEGYYQLSITWAAKQNVNLLSSQFSVYWNDVLVKKFTPIDYNIHKQTLIVKANQGANKLSLRGEGINDYMGAAIKLVELFGQAKPILQYDTSVNYISNPDFSQPKVVTGDFIIGQSAGAWSEVNKLIEVGRGTFYNSRFTSGQVCELAAHYNSNIYQTINLNEGYYQLSITWAAKQNVNLLSSQFSVYWNDVLVKKFTPIDYNIHKQTLIVKANQGANKLSLRGEGINDYMGAAIKLVELFGQAKPILQYDTSVNYISNPDFSQPKVVTGDFIIGQSAGAWSEVNKLIEVGRGTFYNSRFTSGQVCELAAHYNSNIYQTINLNEGYYQLSITWAAKQNVNLLSSQFSVYWNDVLVKKFTPIDYNIHKQTLIVKANQGANKLSLRGEGINDYMGAAIKLVELFGQAKPILQYDTSVNYISNPDFSQPKVVTGDFIIGQSAGAWSEVNKLIEVGRGTFYNSRFTSGQVCELAAHYNSNIYQTINLNEGYYQLSITWAAKQNVNLLSSQFSVYWNDVLVKKFTPIDYNIHKQTLIVKANQGANKLSLRGEGINDYMGAAIKLVELFGQAKPTNQFSSSIITRQIIGNIDNGVSNPVHSKPMYTKSVDAKNVKIQYGSWPSGQQCDLSSDHRRTICKTINLKEGYYQLNITWAANQFVNFANSKWFLYWNNVQIKSFAATDYEINQETLIVKAIQGANKISIKSESDSSFLGAGIKSIKLFGPIKLSSNSSIITKQNINNNIEIEDTLSEFSKPTDTESVDTKPIDSKPVDNKPINTKFVDNKHFNTKSLDTKSTDTESVDTKPIDTQSVDIKNILSYDTSVNYIFNPDFSQPKLGTGKTSYLPRAGAWSEVTNKIEIGDAKIWNRRWSSGQLCDLSSDRLSTIYQIINIDTGYYQLSITWAANQLFKFNKSKWSLYWNDVLIKSFVGTNYEIHKETLIVKANQGANNISLKGQSDSPFFGAGIKLVELYGQNYIKNGNFQTPDTRGGWQIISSAGQWSSYTNQIEIGAGTIYNSVWETGQIAQLDANKNSQLYQIVSIPSGNYHLKFDWAARSGVPLASNGFSVWWNGDRLALTTATDYSLHVFTADVVANDKKDNILLIKGEGTSDGLGVGIDNVRLWTAI